MGVELTADFQLHPELGISGVVISVNLCAFVTGREPFLHLSFNEEGESNAYL